MQFNELVSPSMQELFIKSIEDAILSGKLNIGDKLPSERDLAGQMKVSRSIVNLGLQELVRLGFVEILPRKGAYVADYVRNGNLSTLLEIINYNGGKFDQHTFESLMEFRLINEGELAALSAKNRTAEDLANIKYHLDMIANSTDNMSMSLAIFKYHHALVCATGNNIYPLVHNDFLGVSVTLMNVVLSALPNARILDGYEHIYMAISDQKPDVAKEEMLSLIRSGIVLLRELYFA